MPTLKRFKTNYPGVFYIEGAAVGTGKAEKIFYIRYRKAGKLIEEKAGRQFQDDMTPARAARIRGERIAGKRDTRQEMRDKAKAMKEAEAGRWTINRLWQEYTAHRPLKGLAQDRSRFENYLKPVWGDKEPHEILPLEVDRLRLRILKDKAPQTAKLTLALLRRIVNYGVRRLLCQPLTFHLEFPKVNNLRTEDLTPEQLGALLEAIDQDSNIQAANFMKMALFTGMRRGELFRLQWEDIDFDRGFIDIRQPKGGVDQKIPLNQAARDLLAVHPRTGSPYVFPGRGGNRRTDINKQVNRIKQAAGLPKDFRALHGLRHVYASMLVSSGQVDLYTLQKLLTHKSPQMTMRYAHLRDEALRRASEVAGDLLSRAVNSNQAKGINHGSQPGT
jgi:integrase